MVRVHQGAHPPRPLVGVVFTRGCCLVRPKAAVSKTVIAGSNPAIHAKWLDDRRSRSVINKPTQPASGWGRPRYCTASRSLSAPHCALGSNDAQYKISARRRIGGTAHQTPSQTAARHRTPKPSDSRFEPAAQYRPDSRDRHGLHKSAGKTLGRVGAHPTSMPAATPPPNARHTEPRIRADCARTRPPGPHGPQPNSDPEEAHRGLRNAVDNGRQERLSPS